MATAATGKTGNGANEAPDLEADIKQLKADLEKLAKQMAATGEHGYGTARRAAAAGAEQLRAQGRGQARGIARQREGHRRADTGHSAREARHVTRDRGGRGLSLRASRPTLAAPHAGVADRKPGVRRDASGHPAGAPGGHCISARRGGWPVRRRLPDRCPLHLAVRQVRSPGNSDRFRHRFHRSCTRDPARPSPDGEVARHTRRRKAQVGSDGDGHSGRHRGAAYAWHAAVPGSARCLLRPSRSSPMRSIAKTPSRTLIRTSLRSRCPG